VKKRQVRRDRPLSRFLFLFLIILALSACQSSSPPQNTPFTPTSTPAPTATPVSAPPGVLWVDTSSDLGEISNYVLGANHGPWSDLGIGNLEAAKESGITFLRWPGGNWGDRNDIRPEQITNYLNVSRNMMGAEPSITVRLLGSTPEKAADLVRYVNIEKGYGVKYWSIGNEPDLYVVADPTWTPEYYARRWREFAQAMKAVDPGIIFYGPDISNFVGDQGSFDPLELLYRNGNKLDFTKIDYLTEFLKVNSDLVEIVTIHRYSFPLRSNDGLPTWEQLRDNTSQWDRIIPNLRRIIQETTGKEYPVGVMEFNSHTSNVAGGETSPDSFYNALWLADILGRMIREQPDMLAYWLLKSSTSGHGLMDSFNMRPTYYVYQLYKNFGGHLLDASTDIPYVSVFASRRADGSLALMLVNLNSTEIQKPLQLKDGDALKIKEAFLFDANHKAESIAARAFTNGSEITLPAESVSLYILK
jgi:hypothetical protein